MLFCGAFAVIGVGGIAWAPSDPTLPQWVYYLFVAFLAFGVLFSVAGVNGIRANRRYQAMRAQFPRELWKADYDWQSEGAFDESSRTLTSFVVFATLSSVMLVPFYFVAVENGGGFAFFGALFSLVPLYCVCYVVHRLMRRAKFGRSYLRFDRFPYFLGEELRVEWRPGKPIGAFTSMNFTLHCIEEQQVKDSDGESSQRCIELFEQTISIAEPGEKNDTAEVPLIFQIPNPPRPLGTQFTSVTPRYWELDVRAATSGIKYSETFTVPVYALPRARTLSDRATLSAPALPE